MGHAAVASRAEAVQAVHHALELVQQLRLAHNEFIAAVEQDVKALHMRIDTISAWSERNESAIAAAERRCVQTMDEILTTVEAQRDLRDAFEGMTLLQRVAWLVCGRLPARACAVDVVEASAVETVA